MGEFNSSKTRVGPVFTRLLTRDPTGASWLPKLLELPRRFDDGDVDSPRALGRIVRCAWHPEEIRLRAPRSLLRMLVDDPGLLSPQGLASSRPEVREKRERLIAGDLETRREALALLESTPTDRAWYVFEGPTSVDAYIETEHAIVLVEGKRTEPGPTRHTAWMPMRDQLLRNLDAAWDIADDKQILGFFVVEAESGVDTVSQMWQGFSNETVSPTVIDASLPHREASEREAIAQAFLGVTTWQHVCRTFTIPIKTLP